MVSFFNRAWRLVFFLVAASAAIFVDFMLAARLAEIEVAAKFLEISQRLPFALDGWTVPYLATGFLYSSLFHFIDVDYEYDDPFDRLLAIALPLWWPLGLIGEILGAYAIVTQDGIIRRIFEFLHTSIFFRMTYLLALGIGTLLFVNRLV